VLKGEILYKSELLRKDVRKNKIARKKENERLL